MSIFRKYLIKNLSKTYNNVSHTYGYETKSKRIANRLEKDHNVDASCISGNFSAKPDVIYLYTIIDLIIHMKIAYFSKNCTISLL